MAAGVVRGKWGRGAVVVAEELPAAGGGWGWVIPFSLDA